jgi:hypothetical protein
MGECAGNEASQRELQTPPGLSLGRAVFFFLSNEVKENIKAPFKVKYVFKGRKSLQEEFRNESTVDACAERTE